MSKLAQINNEQWIDPWIVDGVLGKPEEGKIYILLKGRTHITINVEEVDVDSTVDWIVDNVNSQRWS